jgi:hypothetical protein
LVDFAAESIYGKSFHNMLQFIVVYSYLKV